MPVNMKFTYRQETIPASGKPYTQRLEKLNLGTSVPVLGIGIIPGGGTKSLHTGPCGQKKKKT